jgi:hypothetical protein
MVGSSCAKLLIIKVRDSVLLLMCGYGELMIRMVGVVAVTALVLP